MDAAKRQALEAAGWKCGDAEDFLGTNELEGMRMDYDKRERRVYCILTLLATVRAAKQVLETQIPDNDIDNDYLLAARKSLSLLENKLADDYDITFIEE